MPTDTPTQHPIKAKSSSKRTRPKKPDKKKHHLNESPLSPQNHTFTPRQTIQHTPNKLCTLLLPPPLPALFDDSESTRHKRAPSDIMTASIASQMTESSPHSIRHVHHSNASVSLSEVPQNLRVGMSCDALLAFGYVLVGTVDGRVAVYKLIDCEVEVDEDVAASEWRRRKEWDEEDEDCCSDEEKKEVSVATNEEEEEDMVERMNRRYRCREFVEPLLVVSLPPSGTHMHGEDDNGVNCQSSLVFPMVVGMCATPHGMSLIQSCDEFRTQRFMGHVAVLTDDGGVHILEFLSTDPSNVEPGKHTTEERSDCVPIVNVVCSFRTQHLGATCICMQPIFNDQDLDPTTNPHRDPNHTIQHEHLRLCIGHECGVLECYRLSFSTVQPDPVTPKKGSNSTTLTSPYSLGKAKSNEIPRVNSKGNLNKDTSTPRRNKSFASANQTTESGNGKAEGSDKSVEAKTQLVRTKSEPVDQMASPTPQQKQPSNGSPNTTKGPINIELCWRGNIHVPIRSITCPGWNSSLAGSKAQSLLAVGLMQRSSETSLYEVDRNGLRSNNLELSPAISLEVIDASLVQGYWIQMKQETAKGDTITVENRSLAVPLNECSVWPAAGMEVKDGWIRDLQCRETVGRELGLRSVSVTNKMCQFMGNSPCFAFAASDGTVAISHYNPDGTWGIHNEHNQVLLPQRCIGLGTLDYTESDNLKRYVCCCLRGGTIYLVPVIDHATNKSNDTSHVITMFVAPVDSSGEDDGIIRYVQNFTSGMARVSSWHDLPNRMVHTATEGVVKTTTLKSVALLGWNGGTIDVYEISPVETIHDKALFQQLVDESLVVKLVEKLLVISKSHPLVSSGVWCEAWDECNRSKNLDNILRGIKDVSRSDFSSSRTLIMNLIESE